MAVTVMKRSSFDGPPLMSVAREQLVRLPGSPGPGRIIGKIARGQSLPHIQYRGDDGPSGLHHVRALEQRRIADHTIVDEPLIAGAGDGPEIIGVLEIHLDRA